MSQLKPPFSASAKHLTNAVHARPRAQGVEAPVRHPSAAGTTAITKCFSSSCPETCSVLIVFRMFRVLCHAGYAPRERSRHERAGLQGCSIGVDVQFPDEHLRISRVERSHVALAEEGGEQSTRCLQCSKDFARKSALDHFIRKAHGLDPDDVKCWVVVAYGRAVRKGRLHQMKLTTVLAKRSLPERGRL